MSRPYGFFARMLQASKSHPTRAELLKAEREAQAKLTEKRGRVENVVPKGKP